jgi:type II secretory pathway pseudopilin PulG
MRRKCFTLVELLVTKMRRKCFTLVELLVVIGIIAVLMGILLPALNTVRRTAQRVVCSSNQGGIGKAIQAYANEHNSEYPRAGDATRKWSVNGYIEDWQNQDGYQYGKTSAGATITSCLYLLVKWEDVTPGQFVCRGDSGTKELKLSDAPDLDRNIIDDVTDVWDFGSKKVAKTMPAIDSQGWPGQYNSYAYHSPFLNDKATLPGASVGQSFPISAFSTPESPVTADRNPYLDKNAAPYLEGKMAGEKAPTCETVDGIPTFKDPFKTINSAAHNRDGQNVLFNDMHVRFEPQPNVGIGKDNIWKAWTSLTPLIGCDREKGPDNYTTILSHDGKAAPFSTEDAFLVSEHNKGH